MARKAARKRAPSPMNWQAYQEALFEKLVSEFPEPEFRVVAEPDDETRRQGRFSQIPRKADIIVFRNSASPEPYLVAEAKRHGRRLDVKHIEAFMGMLQDLDIHWGIIASPQGASKAAKRRAAAPSTKVRVDVLSYDEALTWHWTSVAQKLFPGDYFFHPQMASAFQRLNRHDIDGFIEIMEDDVPYEEWLTVVTKAPIHLRSAVQEALFAIAQHHHDDGWRYNAIQQLDGALEPDFISHLLENEQDRDVRELLEDLQRRLN